MTCKLNDKSYFNCQQSLIAQQQLQSNSLEENKALVKSFIEEVFNKHNSNAADKYLGQGAERFRKISNSYLSAFPDLHANIEHIIAEDNFVLVFLNWAGTQKGEFQGMPPTSKPVNMRSADLYRIQNGLIVEHWDVVDSLDLLKQTGAITFNDKSMKQ
jgi:predicted ester cyclase